MTKSELTGTGGLPVCA